MSLEGLAIGDAFGEMCFYAPETARQRVEEGWLTAGRWWHTDDTEMALAIVEILRRYGHIEQDALAQRFAERFAADPDRGYGKMAHIILRSILERGDWHRASSAAFSAGGSMGNGGAMRVAPLGGWFAEDIDRVAEEARASAQITHAHSEGEAGTIAVAVAAAVTYHERSEPPQQAANKIFEAVIARTPEGETR